MIVQCPNCQAKFKLPDDKVGPSGARLRCSKCRNVFRVDPPQPSDDDGLTDFDFPDDLAPTPPRAGAAGGADRTGPGAAMPDDDIPAGLFHSESYDAAPASKKGRDPEPELEDDFPGGPIKPGFSLDDVADLPLPGSRPSKERRKRALLLGGVLVLLVAATLAAVHFLDLWPGRKAAKDAAKAPTAETAAPAADAGKPADKPAAGAPAAPGQPAAQKPEEAAKVKDIMLQNVRQYYVSNEKAGQLFVIEGKAVNNFKAPKEMIKLEASLFDEKGGTLTAKEELAGNTVSLFQLQVMTRDELKNALASQVGVLTNNTNIAPAGEVPFMMVFFDPPEAVKEFGVKVVDAKDPPRQ
jgi:predicted Zn finger-like uncharacterized protein